MSVHRNTSQSHQINTDADFRAWATAVHNALAAMDDLVQTADAGQINLATVLKPTSTNSNAGYEIWRFDDTRQAADPIFFKVWYGIGDSTTKPRLYVEIGQGSDGAGVLTGNVITSTSLLQLVYPSSAPSAGAGTIQVAQSEGALVVFLHGSNASPGSNVNYGFVIERLRDADGNPVSAVGAIAWGANAIKSCTRDSIGVHTSDPSPVLLAVESTGAQDGDVHLGAIVPKTRRLEPMYRAMVPYQQNDITQDTTGTVEVDGLTLSYRAFNTSMPAFADAVLVLEQ